MNYKQVYMWDIKLDLCVDGIFSLVAKVFAYSTLIHPLERFWTSSLHVFEVRATAFVSCKINDISSVSDHFLRYDVKPHTIVQQFFHLT